jgi:hypothetical protein
MIPLVNLDALMLQLKHGEMELSLMKDMSRAGVVIIAEPKGCVNPLYTMIENENLLDSFLDEDLMMMMMTVWMGMMAWTIMGCKCPLAQVREWS